MKEITCCFTGHRTLSVKKAQRIVSRLNNEVDQLIKNGVTNFMSGGALGFDHIAASLVITKRQQGANIRLIFALPCRNQDETWTDRQKLLYRSLLREADEIRYVSEENTPESMGICNRYMVNNSAYCICAFKDRTDGTGQTVRYAQEKGVQVINVAM